MELFDSFYSCLLDADDSVGKPVNENDIEVIQTDSQSSTAGILITSVTVKCFA